MSEYLAFSEIPTAGVTRAWAVRSKKHGDELAVIKWYGAWRQYAVFPTTGTIWNRTCLDDLNDFISARMAERLKRPAPGPPRLPVPPGPRPVA